MSVHSADLLKFAIRASFDTVTCTERKPRVAFVFMLPPSTEHDVLAHGASLVHKGVVDSLAFIEHPTPASSALGSEHWKTLCAGYDLKDSQVVTVPYVYPQGHINTLHEAESFAAFVKDRRQRDVAVIAEPFPHLRATHTRRS
ncbi:MAG: hypothetical protein VX446_08470, partial [Bacteroidota bacterium]|nr:hypothetical protein [Bacteroidota bacterium]